MGQSETSVDGAYSREHRKLLEGTLPKSPMDLLSAEERARLHEDLTRMARTRRHAEDASAYIVMH
jgi:hypothetical protein